MFKNSNKGGIILGFSAGILFTKKFNIAVICIYIIGRTSVIVSIKTISKTSIIKIVEYKRGILYFSSLITSGLNKYAVIIDIKHGKIMGRIKNNAQTMKNSTKQIVTWRFCILL